MELSPISDQDVTLRNRISGSVSVTDPRLKTITRLRFLADKSMGIADLSYCHGVLTDGTAVNVRMPFSQLPYTRKVGTQWYRTPLGALKASLVTEARKAGVHFARLGAFDNLSVMD